MIAGNCFDISIVIEADLATELTLRVPYNTEDACFSSLLQKKGGGGPSWPHPDSVPSNSRRIRLHGQAV